MISLSAASALFPTSSSPHAGPYSCLFHKHSKDPAGFRKLRVGTRTGGALEAAPRPAMLLCPARMKYTSGCSSSAISQVELILILISEDHSRCFDGVLFLRLKQPAKADEKTTSTKSSPITEISPCVSTSPKPLSAFASTAIH